MKKHDIKKKNVRLLLIIMIGLIISTMLIISPLSAETLSTDTAIIAETGQEASPAKDSTNSEPQATPTPSAEGGAAAISSGSLPPPSSASAVSPSAMGGAFSSLMGESFKTDLATGAATLGIPVVVPPGRKNVQPNIALSYSSNNPNGLCGVGWGLPVSAIQRSTKNGVPKYDDTDIFLAGGEELVNIGGSQYRAKMESGFTKYEYISTEKRWVVTDKNGTKYYFGSGEDSKAFPPARSDYVFAWYLDKAVDVYGNEIAYGYEKADNAVYLKCIEYTGNFLCNPALLPDKRVDFIYSTNRPDKLYDNRAGWPLAVKRRLEKIKVSADFNNDSIWEILWTYNLSYTQSPDTSRSLLTSIQLEDGQHNTLPAKTFTYQKLD